MKEYLFSYGTLQKAEVQQALFGRTLQGSADTLRGYIVTEIEITDNTFLSNNEKNQLTAIPSADKNAFIQGTVLEMTTGELCRADQYEPANYKRVNVFLESGKQAWLYLAVEFT